MSTISNLFNRLSLTQLRILYALVAAVPLLVIIAQAAVFSRHSYMTSDDCIWDVRNVNGQWELIVVELPSGGRAVEAGIQVGDRVVSINDIPAPNSPNAPFVMQNVLNSSPDEVPLPYVVERNGKVLTLTISLVRYFLFLNWTVLAFASIWLVIGVIVGMTQPRGRVQRRFFMAGVTALFAFIHPSNLYSQQTPTLVITLVNTLWVVGFCLFFVSWVRFCMTFPVDQKVLSSPMRKSALYALPVLYVLLAFVPFFVPELGRRLVELYLYFTLAFSILYFAAGVWFLVRGRRSMPATTNPRPVTVIIVGSILAGATLIYVETLQIANRAISILNPEVLLPIVLVLALPLSFGYAIFKYQVMDFRPVVRATVVYGMSMVLIAALYLALAFGVGRALGSLTGEDLKGTVEVFAFVLFVVLLEPMKRRMQTAIENRFFPQRRDYSGALAAFSAEIVETVGTVAVAELTARTLKNVLGLQGAYLLIENEREGDLQLIAKASQFQPIAIEEEAIYRLREMLYSSHSLISLETVSEPKLADLQRWFSYAIGLYAQGRVIGAVVMTRPVDGEPLSGSQMPFVAGIVAQAASALEVARLYEEELARIRYLEELATARKIQESLLPAEVPTLLEAAGISISAVSRPAHSVGGDYYDVIQLDPERFLVIIADVSGKGLPASLYMAEFHGMIHIASAVCDTPQQILEMLNKHLLEVIARGSFITASLLMFDTARHTVSYARAGHTPIIRRRGSEADPLQPSGIALGLGHQELFASALQQYSVHYEPGETFILYSDGVSEAMNERREEFGDGRLLDVIKAAPNASAESLRERILSRIDEFRGSAEQNDDVTLVVIRIEKEVGRDISNVPVLSRVNV